MVLDNNWGVMMENTLFIFGIFFIIAVILVTVVLVLLKKHQYKKAREQVEYLDKEKNLIASTPVYSELEKLEAIIKNEKMEEKYKNWQKRFDVIKNEKINIINDMLNELDIASTLKDYKSFDQKLAKTEMEVYKVRESANKLLEEIKEITISDEKYRTIVTKLKSKYRKLLSEFNNHKDDYEEIAEAIELQFETIEKRFLDFEKCMEKNEYDEVTHIIKALDTMIDHMGSVVVEVPNLMLLSTKLIPKRIEEITNLNTSMKEEGFNLEYLNIPYNMDECNKNVSEILDRIRVLNLNDCMFELKTVLDYLDNVLDDLEKEQNNKKIFKENVSVFDKKIKKTSRIIRDIFKQIDSIRDLYDLGDDEVKVMETIKLELEAIRKDYQILLNDDINAKRPYSVLNKELDTLSNLLAGLENRLDESLKSIGSMKDDELRAREQLDEIRDLLKQCKLSIRSYKLPIIISNFFVELSEANDAIDEVAIELSKKPIVIDTLNTRVDTARDLALKLYQTASTTTKTAAMAEMAIVYGNRYRSSNKEVEKGLNASSKAFYKGEYKDSLEIVLNTLNIVEPGIHKKILSKMES